MVGALPNRMRARNSQCGPRTVTEEQWCVELRRTKAVCALMPSIAVRSTPVTRLRDQLKAILAEALLR